MKIVRAENWNTVLKEDDEYKAAMTDFDLKKTVILERVKQEKEPNYNKPTVKFVEKEED